MIPIGTKCISTDQDAPWCGSVVTVIAHWDPAEPTNCDGSHYDCVLDIEGRYTWRHTWRPWEWGKWWDATSLFSRLIPIGHDPDTETRTTDSEVTA